MDRFSLQRSQPDRATIFSRQLANRVSTLLVLMFSFSKDPSPRKSGVSSIAFRRDPVQRSSQDYAPKRQQGSSSHATMAGRATVPVLVL
jgi:hypothetical protein